MSSERVSTIEKKLTEAFSPTKLLVKDQSHLHAGHAGARSGGGHFQVIIVSSAFAGKRPLERHRMIFAALESMMENEIHALSIDASAGDEPATE
ncbi:MAG: BolA family transcriptional regulator [Gammaproteobacteria bacterium]|nr:BolA family transcriptional regulator [Gammaproteobacteria bacterium]NNL50555.1 BolA family transcriptional regulator [Woeseiaceae bacterium]